MQKSTNFVPIVRFLPSAVSNIVFSYLTMMRPMYDVLNYYLDDKFTPSPTLNLKDVECFRKDFKNCFMGGLGVNVGIATYRHLVIHFMRNALRQWKTTKDLFATNQMDSIMNDLAAHSEQTDLENYATTKITRSFSMTEFDFEGYRKVCGLWHTLLGLDLILPPTVEVKEECSPKQIQKKLILPTTTTKLFSKHGTEATSYIQRYTVHQHFKSTEQYLGCLHSLYETTDLMLSLPTGGGKSLTYQLPALVHREKIIVLVVPLVSIIRDVTVNMQDFGISTFLFRDYNFDSSFAKGGVYIAHYGEDEKVLVNIRAFIGYNSNHIQAIFFDEAHLLTEWTDLMNLRKFIGLRGTQKIKYVFLSATLNTATISSIKTMMVLDNFDTIRKYDDNSQMKYIVTVKPTNHELLKYVRLQISTFAGKALVFFQDLKKLNYYKEKFIEVGIFPQCYY